MTKTHSERSGGGPLAHPSSPAGLRRHTPICARTRLEIEPFAARTGSSHRARAKHRSEGSANPRRRRHEAVPAPATPGREARVVSATRGRLRAHLPGWSEVGRAEIERQLLELPGVHKVDANPLTRNVLVLYEPSELDQDTVLAALGALDPDAAARAGRRRVAQAERATRRRAPEAAGSQDHVPSGMPGPVPLVGATARVVGIPLRLGAVGLRFLLRAEKTSIRRAGVGRLATAADRVGWLARIARRAQEVLDRVAGHELVRGLIGLASVTPSGRFAGLALMGVDVLSSVVEIRARRQRQTGLGWTAAVEQEITARLRGHAQDRVRAAVLEALAAARGSRRPTMKGARGADPMIAITDATWLAIAVRLLRAVAPHQRHLAAVSSLFAACGSVVGLLAERGLGSDPRY